jgi:hypothetical protein
MQLSSGTLLIIFAVFIIAYYVYQVYTTRNRVWCVFRRRDRGRIEKWAKVDQTRIEFDGGWYDVDPGRITFGIKWMPLPLAVKVLDFRHDSSLALDPSSFNNEYTPTQRKQLGISDDLRDFAEGQQQSFGGKPAKKSMLEQWFPIIVILLIIVLGYMTYSINKKVDLVGFGNNAIQEQLNELQQGD